MLVYEGVWGCGADPEPSLHCHSSAATVNDSVFGSLLCSATPLLSSPTLCSSSEIPVSRIYACSYWRIDVQPFLVVAYQCTAHERNFKHRGSTLYSSQKFNNERQASGQVEFSSVRLSKDENLEQSSSQRQRRYRVSLSHQCEDGLLQRPDYGT